MAAPVSVIRIQVLPGRLKPFRIVVVFWPGGSPMGWSATIRSPGSAQSPSELKSTSTSRKRGPGPVKLMFEIWILTGFVLTRPSSVVVSASTWRESGSPSTDGPNLALVMSLWRAPSFANSEG